MFSLAELELLYEISGVFGLGFFVFTAATSGAHGGGHGTGHGGGHGIGHGGGHAVGHAIGHGVGHGGGHAGGHATGHSGGAGHSAGGAAGHGGAGSGHGAGHQGGHAVGKAVGDGINHALGHSLGHMVSGHSGGVAGNGGAAGGLVGGAHGTTGSHGVSAGQAAGLGGHGAADGGNAQGSNMQGMSGSTQALTGPMHITKGRLNLWELVLAVLNLMRVASFSFFFGLTGYLCITSFPWLGFLTLIPALVAGYIGSNLVLFAFGYLYQKMQVSTLAIVEEMVGQLGEVTVPVPPGRIGAITYVIESKRYSSSAKALNPTYALKKGDKIMIAEFRDAVAYVEPWNEALCEIGFQPESGETLDSIESLPVQESQPQPCHSVELPIVQLSLRCIWSADASRIVDNSDTIYRVID